MEAHPFLPITCYWAFGCYVFITFFPNVPEFTIASFTQFSFSIIPKFLLLVFTDLFEFFELSSFIFNKMGL